MMFLTYFVTVMEEGRRNTPSLIYSTINFAEKSLANMHLFSFLSK